MSCRAPRASGFIIFRRIAKHPVQFLILQTSYGTHHWTPPKGHVEGNESDKETAFRETEEEAGLNARSLGVVEDFKVELEYMVKGKPKSVIYWLAELKDNSKVQLSSEHQNYEWADLSRACDLVGYHDTKNALQIADKYIKENC